MKRSQLTRKTELKRTRLRRGRGFRRYEGQDDFRKGVWALSRDRQCPVLLRYAAQIEAHLAGQGPAPEPLDTHHVVSKEELSDRGKAHLAADPRNGMLIGRKAHDEHETRKRPIAYEDLPECAVAFAAEHGFSDWLARTYPRRAA